MVTFAEALKKVRTEKGHKNARAFYDWLKDKGVSFNYSYYMRLEQGGLPSEKVVNELANALKSPWADKLILAYCKSLFPKHSYLFPEGATMSAGDGDDYSPEGSSLTSAQKELSVKQVVALASQEDVYHLFLLSTLARKPMEAKELEKWFSAKSLANAKKVLIGEGLLREGPEGIEATSIESRFPDAYNQELKDAYKKFDQWDDDFGSRFELDYLMNKALIRRASGRYLLLIRKQMELLAELVKTSDETDIRFNDSVLQMKLVLRQGKLPG